MGFIERGRLVRIDNYKPTYFKEKALKAHADGNKVLKTPHSKGKKRVIILKGSTVTVSLEKSVAKKPLSIIERLPVELIYEIHTLTGLGNLKLANKFLHNILDPSSHPHLIRKFIRHHLHKEPQEKKPETEVEGREETDSSDSIPTNTSFILDYDVLNYNVVTADYLKEIDIRRVGVFNRGTRTMQDIDIDHDIPTRLYRPNFKRDIDLINYLIKLNFHIKDLNHLLVNILEREGADNSLDVSLEDIVTLLDEQNKKQDSKIVLDVEVLIKLLDNTNFKMSRYLIEHNYFDSDELERSSELWDSLIQNRAAEIFKFLVSLNVHPSLSIENAWNII